MENIELQDFINSVTKAKEHRVHKIINSYGVYDGFKYYRKNRPKESKYKLTESQYFSIIRKVNLLLRERLLGGEDIIFPSRLGRLEVRKYTPKITIKEGKVQTTLPIDWGRTLKLWYEDKESYNNKTLIKVNEENIYSIFYNKNTARYKNKLFYAFNANKELKKHLKNNIKDCTIDTFEF